MVIRKQEGISSVKEPQDREVTETSPGYSQDGKGQSREELRLQGKPGSHSGLSLQGPGSHPVSVTLSWEVLGKLLSFLICKAWINTATVARVK